MSIKIGVLGATTMIGIEVLSVLSERGVSILNVHALTGRETMGRDVSYGDQTLVTQDVDDFDLSSIDLCILCLGDKPARKWAPKLAAAGVLTIDVSAAFRLDADVPLVSADANPEQAKLFGERRLVALPGGHASLLAAVLKPLNDAYGLRRATVTACLAASETGRTAMDEVWTQTKGIFVNQPAETKEFSKQIAFNLIPAVGGFRDDGVTDSEHDLVEETRKILGADTAIQATCLNVPVFVGHALLVHLDLERPFVTQDIRNNLREAPGVVVVDNREEETFVTPVEAVGDWSVYVSRIREQAGDPYGLALTIVGDNLRKSALNAVQVAERLQQSGAFAKPIEN